MEHFDLDGAVRAGVLRSDQADALRRFDESERHAPAATEERFGLVGGFADIMAAAGIAIAWLMYVARPGMADSLAAAFKLPYQVIYNKWFVDEIYDAAVVKPVVGGSRLLLWKGVDQGLIDGSVNGVGSRAFVSQIVRQFGSRKS